MCAVSDKLRYESDHSSDFINSRSFNLCNCEHLWRVVSRFGFKCLVPAHNWINCATNSKLVRFMCSSIPFCMRESARLIPSIRISALLFLKRNQLFPFNSRNTNKTSHLIAQVTTWDVKQTTIYNCLRKEKKQCGKKAKQTQHHTNKHRNCRFKEIRTREKWHSINWIAFLLTSRCSSGYAIKVKTIVLIWCFCKWKKWRAYKSRVYVCKLLRQCNCVTSQIQGKRCHPQSYAIGDICHNLSAKYSSDNTTIETKTNILKHCIDIKSSEYLCDRSQKCT